MACPICEKEYDLHTNDDLNRCLAIKQLSE